MLLPAVQGAREAARRTQCSNNLKQLGLGLQSYQEARQVFPGGGYGLSMASLAVANQPGAAARRMASWGTAVLPFIDQAPLYASINQSLWYIAPENSTAGQVIVSTFLCPTNQFASLTRPNPDNTVGSIQYAATTTRGTTGNVPSAATPP